MTKTTNRAAAQQGTTLHRALSDPSRVRILELVQQDVEVVERLEPELEHPVRLALVLGDRRSCWVLMWPPRPVGWKAS